MAWQSERIDSDVWLYMITQGIRVDISSLAYLLAIPVLISSISWLIGKGTKFTYWFCKVWLVTMLATLVYLEVLTPTFINEYDLRPNRLFIEYLIYPKQVFSMLWTGYKLEIALSTLALIATAGVGIKLFKRHWGQTNRLNICLKLLVVAALMVAMCIGARSSFGHRPMNPAMVSFSTDHLLNDLVLNSSYSVSFAIKQMAHEKSSEHYYGAMPIEQVINTVKQTTITPLSEFSHDDFPTNHYLSASYQGKPRNLVIILQESLGSRYVGGLGGLPLTPNLDKLMREGWNFTNLYATGTRSVRGIEAVIAGFTPTPARSVVKLDKSQHNFFTLASFLKKHGYHNQFIYGGESHFDNMKSFFLGNGFNDIVDLPEFAKADFVGSWGASDQDLFDQAHLEFSQLAQQKQPFFSLVFTSSNHSPYEFPDNTISLYDQEKHTRNNAAKYADFALGQFIEQAKNSEYWQNTVFIVIADHDSRVAGASLVPIEHFKIPGVIFGQGIEPRVDDRLVSQIDIAPTLLSLLGTSGYTPMIGHDLTQQVPVDKQRAVMQYDKNFAYMSPLGNSQQVTILQPKRESMTFQYGYQQFSRMKLDHDQASKAKAIALFGSYAYHNRWF
ncbi:LTA synthase family protein [Endozoicomonas sp. G2_1]|nr:LTA synthase family protein [Endozoicomonas sp. G2_1]